MINILLKCSSKFMVINFYSCYSKESNCISGVATTDRCFKTLELSDTFNTELMFLQMFVTSRFCLTKTNISL